MNQIAIFWPMIAHVALVFGIYFLIFLRRKAAVQSGSAKISQFRENTNEPTESLFVRNNLANQFELPVLFHVVCLALYVVNAADVVAVVLAWLFVISRYVHAYIHVTSNRIRYRQPAFSVGFFVLIVMWVWLAIAIL
ncbi:MAPEG family protein [Aliihoeflea sp. PC F10.4]